MSSTWAISAIRRSMRNPSGGQQSFWEKWGNYSPKVGTKMIFTGLLIKLFRELWTCEIFLVVKSFMECQCLLFWRLEIPSVSNRKHPLCFINSHPSQVTHFGMFVPTLRTLGTPEQQAEWVERAWNCNVTGSYVQTELGHGTFVRGLETTATYDPQAQEFVIHSPSVSAYKVSGCWSDSWWRC